MSRAFRRTSLVVAVFVFVGILFVASSEARRRSKKKDPLDRIAQVIAKDARGKCELRLRMPLRDMLGLGF